MNQEIINYVKDKFPKINIIYVDKFWNNINNKQWLYVDNTLIVWIGYRKENGKSKYLKFIKENFKDNIDYKIYNYEETKQIFHYPLRGNENNQEIIRFKDKINAGNNRTQHLIISPKCFKKSLMMIQTEKANEIRNYYLEVEEICLDFNKFLLKSKDIDIKDIHYKNKLDKHNYLIEKFKGKRCVYILEIEENSLIKVGSSKDIQRRLRSLKEEYGKQSIYLDIYPCDTYIEAETDIHNNELFKNNLYKQVFNKTMPKEIVKLTDKFNYNQLVQLVKQYTSIIKFLNPQEQLESKRIDLESKKIDLELKKLKLVEKLLNNNYNPELLNNININITNIENTELKENIIDEEISILTKQVNNIELEEKEETIIETNYNKSINKNNENLRKTQGKRIQKIDPLNLENIIKVYNSMEYVIIDHKDDNFNESNIYKAIKKNTIYKNYRWYMLNNNQDSNGIYALPTVEKKSKVIEDIIKINKEKTEILDTFNSKLSCSKSLGIGRKKMEDIIENIRLFTDNCFYVKLSFCKNNLKLIYDLYQKNGYSSKFIKSHAKAVYQINLITNTKLKFNTLNDASNAVGITTSTITNAIKNKKNIYGCIWEYV